MNIEITVSSVAATMADNNNLNGIEVQTPIITRRPRTSEDFFLFCTYVLEYENYTETLLEESRSTSNPSPPLDSSGSSVNSESSSHDDNENDKNSDDGNDTDLADSYNNVSCFCSKPFAGRPMIECSICFTWIHLSCARIKKSNIPDVFHCAICKASTCKRRSESPPSSNSTLEKKRIKHTPTST